MMSFQYLAKPYDLFTTRGEISRGTDTAVCYLFRRYDHWECDEGLSAVNLQWSIDFYFRETL